jgi:hypothetical protein
MFVQIGGRGHEKTDAQSYASWGIDYLKYDNCWADASDWVLYHHYSIHHDTLMNDLWAASCYCRLLTDIPPCVML